MLRLAAIPYLAATLAVAMVLMSAAVTGGNKLLRRWFFLHMTGLLGFIGGTAGGALAQSPEVATFALKLAAASVPIAGSAGVAFQWALSDLIDQRRRPVTWLLLLSALLFGFTLATDAVVPLVRQLPSGPYVIVGTWPLIIPFAFVTAVSFYGFAAFHVALGKQRSRSKARPWRRVYWGSIVTWLAFIDVLVVFGLSDFPVSWFFIATGAMLNLRALWIDNLLLARALDFRLPVFVLHALVATAVAFVALRLLGGQMPWWVPVPITIAAVATVRIIGSTLISLVRTGQAPGSPVARLISQFSRRTFDANDEHDVAAELRDAFISATGRQPRVFVMTDAAWTRVDKSRRKPSTCPSDAVTAYWRTHAGVHFIDDQRAQAPANLRADLQQFFTTNNGETAVVVTAGTALVLLLFPRLGNDRALVARFAQELAAPAAAALAFSQLARQANQHAAAANQVALAAALQTEFVVPFADFQLRATQIVGSCRAASQCGGDLWFCDRLPDGSQLLVVADVTGHGVSAALLTAAIRGALGVALTHDACHLPTIAEMLDAAVHRAGMGHIGATVVLVRLSPDGDWLEFVSAGHVMPYLVRRTETGSELKVLVARGNPMGTTTAPAASAMVRVPTQAGDRLVLYTDGITEALSDQGAPFGDRRLHRLLRQHGAGLEPRALHDTILTALDAHCSGRPVDDDVTLVIVGVAPPLAPGPAQA